MRTAQGLLIGIVVAVIGAVSWLLSGCDDRPTKPVPQEEPKEYSFYFLDAFSAQCFEYSPSRGIVDSFKMPFTGSYEIRTASLSADGQIMYVTTETALYALDLRTNDTTRIYDSDRRVVASPDGRYLILLEYPLVILSAEDYSVVFSDTLGIVSGTFSGDGRMLFGCGHSELGFVYELSLNDSFSGHATWLNYHVPAVLRVSPDESKWYLYTVDTRYQCMESFEVYDTLLDSIVFSTRIIPGLGSIAVSPEGRFVYFTNPGYQMMPNPDCPEPPYAITVYDAPANQLYQRISTAATYGVVGFQDLNVGPLASTPDGKWILGLAEFGGYVLLDANAGLVTRFEAVGDSLFDHYLFSPMAQTGL